MTDRQSSRMPLLTPQGVTVLGLVVNALLAAGKIAAGVVFRSQAILADGLHSGSDLITDAAVLAGLRVSGRPAAGRHHYGHGRFSTLVAMFVGAALLGAGVWIAYSGIVALREPSGKPVGAGLPFWLAAASVPLKELLYQLTRWVGRRTSNVSLIANAWHHRTDAFSSLAAAAGLAGVYLGGESWRILDPITAIVLAAFLGAIAVRIVHAAAEELVDRAPGEATLRSIARAVAETEGVEDYHAFRARRIGGKVAMDIHVLVNPLLTVQEGHEIASAVQEHVFQADDRVIEAVVHIEPEQSEPDE